MSDIHARYLPLYTTVRARLIVPHDEFHIRRVEQVNSLFADGVFCCPADSAEAALKRIELDLAGIAHLGSWHWVDPTDELGDCFFVELYADADPSLR
jgi:hypothetical protein